MDSCKSLVVVFFGGLLVWFKDIFGDLFDVFLLVFGFFELLLVVVIFVGL